MSEQTFYDKQGRPTAYTYNEHIYLFSGQPVAYFHGDSVYSFSGTHLGRYSNGWIRDNNGYCAFFDQTATGGPMKPMNSSSWSQLSSVAFFS